MDMEFMFGETEIVMRVSGGLASETVMDLTSSQIMINILGNIATVIPTASVNINGLTVIHMLESS